MLSWQRLPPFQPRISQIDMEAALDCIRNPGYPSPPETKQLSHSINEAEKDIADYEQDILSLQELVLDLEKKRDGLKQYINIRNSYLSPIRRLPTEVLARIFLHVSEEIPPKTRIPLSPLIGLKLGQVCKLWHSVSRGTSHLWSHFSMTLSRDYNIDSTFELLRIYLPLSNQLPLSFKITLDDGFTSFHGPKSASSIGTMRLLTDNCHRWGSVCLLFHSISEWNERSLDFKRDLPLLKSLTLERFHEGACPIGVFAGASSHLQEVVLRGFREIPDHLPLEHVQHLQMTDAWISVPMVDFIKSLTTRCSRLCSLELEFISASVNTENREQGFCLGKLEELYLRSITWKQVKALFSLLALPILRKLTLHAISARRENPQDTITITSFTLRSNCLSELTLVDLQSEAGLHALLRSSSSVTRLEFRSSYSNPDVLPVQSLHILTSHSDGFCSLTSGRLSEVVLPNLEILEMTLQVGKKEDFDESALVDTITSRWMSHYDAKTKLRVRCLKSVRLALMEGLPRESLERRLRPLKCSGMIVDIVGI
ncbi:hypothetical protein VKT23_018975 [Stygiomarasmius scandens]|uniref:F-box domain-containing protein n=1 Tax=Marasmiellus scandens TaxID=2682957 RepID=A0ABR1IRQ2_9AGAR